MKSEETAEKIPAERIQKRDGILINASEIS